MSQSKVHSQGNVPFAWENKPGVCKAADGEEEIAQFVIKLRPPPCRPSEKVLPCAHDTQIPLPPCTFQGPPSRSSSKKSHQRKQEDPFLAAYKECTKSTRKEGKGLGFRSGMFNLSCKHSCNVRDDNLIPRLERGERGGRRREDVEKWLNPWK